MADVQRLAPDHILPDFSKLWQTPADSFADVFVAFRVTPDVWPHIESLGMM